VLKKINRIKKRKEFEAIRIEGKIYQSPLFGLVVKKDEGKDKKFGMIVSKKISKRAVDRNKIRRRLAEVIRKNLSNIPEGVSGIVLAKRKLMEVGIEDIEKEFLIIVRQIS
jgi:ribonuclease P protein component